MPLPQRICDRNRTPPALKPNIVDRTTTEKWRERGREDKQEEEKTRNIAVQLAHSQFPWRTDGKEHRTTLPSFTGDLHIYAKADGAPDHLAPGYLATYILYDFTSVIPRPKTSTLAQR